MTYSVVASLQDLVDHANGVSRKHVASSINLSPNVTINGDIATNVQTAIEKLASIAYPPSIPDASFSVKGLIKLSGDLAGTASSPSVKKIQGYPVSNLSPSDGNVLTWDDVSGSWEPKEPSTVVPQATTNQYGIVRLSDGLTQPGDIGGIAGFLKIIKLQDLALNLEDEDNPVAINQFLKWNGSAWVNSYLTLADSTNYGTIRLNGANSDLGGNAETLQVIALQTFPLTISCPSDGDYLSYTLSTGWTNTPLPLASASSRGTIYLKEDVAPGGAGGIRVVGINNSPVANISPLENQYLSFQDGSWAPVDLPCATTTSGGLITLAQDLGGTCDLPLVLGIFGKPFHSSVQDPENNQMLIFDRSLGPDGSWKTISLSIPSEFTAGGDLSGTNNEQAVIGWRGYPLDGTFLAPADGYIPVFDGENAQWTTYNPGGITPGNPQISEYTINGIRNKVYRYQNSVVSTGNDTGILINYTIPDNVGMVISAKIIARVIDTTYAYYTPPAMMPPLDSPSSLNQDEHIFKFDLEDIEVGNVFYFDVDAGYRNNDGYIANLFYRTGDKSGQSQDDITLISTYTQYVTGLYPPTIELISPSSFQIVSGYSSNIIINWTISIEIVENGV